MAAAAAAARAMRRVAPRMARCATDCNPVRAAAAGAQGAIFRRWAHAEASGMEDKVDPFSLVAEEMASLAGRLRDTVSAEIPKLASAAEYFFKLGVEGKRFRPMVLLLMTSSLSMVLPEEAAAAAADQQQQQQQQWRQHKIAEITEMIHVASLLHDDVLDQSDTRRGVASLNSIMGNKLAVLAGDFLLAKAAFALSTLGDNQVVGLMSKVLEHLVAGEVMQWTVEAEEACSMDRYLQKTFFKTASLMANSCKSVALLCGQPERVAALAFDYGRHLGLAYQIVDDLLDFTGTRASLGKPALSDLREGLATAPVLLAARHQPALLPLIRRRFQRPGDTEEALAMVLSGGGIAATRELALHHARLAADAIAALPPTASQRAALCRRALTELAEQAIHRSK